MTAVAATFAALLAAPLLAAPVELHLAPDGNDQADGRTRATAYATPARAQAAARELRAGGVTVLLHGGRYVLAGTLAFGPDDAGTAAAPIVWRAAPGETPVLCGGPVVTGFKPFRDGIYQADLNALGLGGKSFGQLFFNGRRMILARCPNVDPADLHGGAWAHATGAVPDGDKRTFGYDRHELDPSRWSRPSDGRISYFAVYDWAFARGRVKGVDPDQRTITLSDQGHSGFDYGFQVGDRYFIEGNFEELDAPGEWYLDPDKSIIYFYPPEPLDRGAVTIPLVGDLAAFRGTHDVTLRGVVLEGCDGQAVVLENSDRCSVAACTLRNCGGWGASIRGGSACAIEGCDITATGAGGVGVEGGDRARLTPAGHRVDNCYIHHIAAFQRTYNTAINLGGVGNTASHNLVHDTPHAGIVISGNDNVLEYNVIHHTNLQSTDTGGIYSCPRDWTQRGNIIRYNVWHHLGGYGKQSSWQPVNNGKVGFEYPHFTWGIYLDDPTSGFQVYGNILYEVPICGLHNHGGRDNVWENNILVDCPAFQAGRLDPNWSEWVDVYKRLKAVTGPGSPYLDRYPVLRDYQDTRPQAMSGLKIRRNIIYYTAAGTRWNREHRVWGCTPETMRLYDLHTEEPEFGGTEFDQNVIYAEPGIGLEINLARIPQPAERLTFAQWQALGKDTHSVLADPLFVDAAHHDYRLQPDSPALKLGFQPIPVEKIGLYRDDLRATWPVTEAPGADGRVQPITVAWQVPGLEPVPARAFTPRDGLGHFFAKLNAGQGVRVAYYGGGIHPATGWRAGVLKWLQTTYPNCRVEAVDASICDCSRGSGFSVYRYRHDVLERRPDLVMVDFASDDQTTAARDIHRAVEAIVRQTRDADPAIDLVFLYAFRDGNETAYAEGFAPPVVTAYEWLAERYGIAGIDMGYRVAELAREGKLVLKGAAPAGQESFSGDGVRPSPAGDRIYAEAAIGALQQLAAGDPVAHKPAQPLAKDNLERARLVAITPAMLTGDWRELPATDPLRQRFVSHFDTIWCTSTPGAKLTFRFRGTAASLFDLMGPDTGRAKVTVDGVDRGIRQQVDPWSYYQRLAAIDLAGGLKDGEHTVTVELLPDAPNRDVPIGEAKKQNRYNPAEFEGVALRLGWIRMIGEPVP